MANKFEKQYEALGLKAPESEMSPLDKAEVIFSAACKKLGIDPALAPSVYELLGKYQSSLTGLYKLMVIRDAITDNREANWNNRREYKYGGWFWMDSPGFRFSASLFSFSGTSTSGGSRLCTFSEEDQDFFMIECIALWADLYGGNLPK